MSSSIVVDFWVKTSGTWINVGTVLLGTVLGLLLRGKLPLSMQRVLTQGLGLITLFIGISMAGSLNKVQVGAIAGVILGLLAIVLGGLLGEWWQLEEKLQIVGDKLKKYVRGGGSFTEGFMAASLLFCVGPMALIGSLNNGLTGDSALLTIKATMDGLAAIALTSSFGIGVGFSSLPILLYQGSISIAAASLVPIAPQPRDPSPNFADLWDRRIDDYGPGLESAGSNPNPHRFIFAGPTFGPDRLRDSRLAGMTICDRDLLADSRVQSSYC